MKREGVAQREAEAASGGRCNAGYNQSRGRFRDKERTRC